MQKLRQLVIFSFLLSAGASSAIGATCKVEDPDIATQYSGGCRNGLAHGKGTAIGRDKYVGDFRDGKLSGKGIYSWANGNRYEGEYRDGNPNGKGVYTRPSGTRYEGGWRDAQRNGYGVLTVARSDYHELKGKSSKGDWKGDQYIEQGIFESGALILQCPSEKACAELQASARKTEEGSSGGKGIVMPLNSKPRYEELHDGKYGTVVRDNQRGIEFTKCFVGMTSNGPNQPCEGKAQKASWTEANNFAKSLGGGWRLVPLDEIHLYIKNHPNIESSLDKAHYGPWWSGTGTVDTENAYYAYGIVGLTQIDTKLAFLLMRRFK